MWLRVFLLDAELERLVQLTLKCRSTFSNQTQKFQFRRIQCFFLSRSRKLVSSEFRTKTASGFRISIIVKIFIYVIFWNFSIFHATQSITEKNTFENALHLDVLELYNFCFIPCNKNCANRLYTNSFKSSTPETFNRILVHVNNTC